MSVDSSLRAARIALHCMHVHAYRLLFEGLVNRLFLSQPHARNRIFALPAAVPAAALPSLRLIVRTTPAVVAVDAAATARAAARDSSAAHSSAAVEATSGVGSHHRPTSLSQDPGVLDPQLPTYSVLIEMADEDHDGDEATEVRASDKEVWRVRVRVRGWVRVRVRFRFRVRVRVRVRVWVWVRVSC